MCQTPSRSFTLCPVIISRCFFMIHPTSFSKDITLEMSLSLTLEMSLCLTNATNFKCNNMQRSLFPEFHFVVVQSLNCFRLFATPQTEAHQFPLSFTISWSLLKFMSIELVMPSNHLILCCPLLLLLLSFFPSIRVLSSESDLRIRWSEYWSFSIKPFNDYSGLISFRID